jgi:hypothetical protein
LGTTTKQLKFCIGAIVLILACLCGWLFHLKAQSSCSSIVLCGTTGSIGGGALLLGGTTSGTASISNANVGMPCFAQANDGTNMAAAGFTIQCTVTSSGTATVTVSAAVAGTPAAKSYVIRVLE